MADLIPVRPKRKQHKPRIGVVIQARMTSTRFPGKSLVLLCGKPVIQHTMERAQKIRQPKDYHKPWVVLAVSDEPESEPMLELADSLKVGNFIGEKGNVLDRYFHCAAFFSFDIIVRLTGDCPFIDPKVCSECLQLLIWRKLDYVSNSFPLRTYETGLDCEVFTFDCLEAAHVLANDPYDLEHVTPWMQREPEVKKFNVVQREDRSSVNYCVDYPEDIERLEKLVGYKRDENKTN